MAPDNTGTAAGGQAGPAVLEVPALQALFDALISRGYTLIGPTVRDEAIVLAELTSADELPFGWGVTTEAGIYRLRARTDRAAFGHSAGPQSWKSVLHPARARLWSADRRTGEVTPGEAAEHGPYALIGVRGCDLRAIGILDRVLARGRYADPVYRTRRAGTFVVGVECGEPGATCFCSSMGTGPGVDDGYDLALTELVDGGSHRFLARAGSAAGAEVLAELPATEADEAVVTAARDLVADAATHMSRAMPPVSMSDLIAASRESPHWDDVASRCLTCGNCTMVCPTCFCVTTEDVTDLTGEHAERWRRWDSCYDLDFTYMGGGSVRSSGQSRYRQWISHKLGTWYDQFGSSGCVGCGRCIVWCPVGIDITQEAAALAALAAGAPAAQPTGGES